MTSTALKARGDPVHIQRVTQTIEDVMRLYFEDSGRRLTAVEILAETGHRSGTIYPLLARLCKSNWLKDVWEKIDPETEGRAPRRQYTATEAGLKEARRKISEKEARKQKRNEKLEVSSTNTVPASA